MPAKDKKKLISLDKEKTYLKLVILNLDSVLYDDYVKAISTFNDNGQFDVLYMHENFISIIKKTIYIFRIDGVEEKIDIDEGIMKVMGNKVQIFLGFRN